jgi:serine/threonine-protein kinase
MAAKRVGRYALHDEIASGGMATVRYARLSGEGSFSRVVAVKVLHAQYAKEEAFRAMFLDEARLVSRIRHPNVVATLDVQEEEGELFLFMDYVHGESLSKLLRLASSRAESVPVPIAVGILVDALEGLHAAHEATSEQGTPLHVVHRDVSPQNILVASDGVVKVADFGVAKAVGRLAEKFSVHHTVKGKAGYMAPEQVRGSADRRADLYAAGVVLWEALAGRRLFTGESFMEIVMQALEARVAPPSSLRADVPPELDAVVLRAVSEDPARRWSTAREFAVALEQCTPRASARAIGEWVQRIAKSSLDARAEQIARIEADDGSRVTVPDRIQGTIDEAMIEDVQGSSRADVPAVHTSGVVLSRLTRARRVLPIAAALAAVTLGVAGLTSARVFAPSTRAPEASPPVAAPPPEPAPSPAAAVPAPSTPSEPVASMSTPPSTPAPVAPSARPAPSKPARSIPRAPAARPSAQRECRWVELPDDQGILIPKKVCP